MTEPDLEFDFQLAELLHMPVAEMRERVSSLEHLQWNVFLGRRAQRQEIAEKRAAASWK